MTYDNWKTTNSADEFLGPEPDDDMPDTNAERVSHTPGPWLVEDDGDGGQVHHNGDKVADTFDLMDARLIAAAPDMLAALKDVLAGVAWSETEPGHASGLQLIVRKSIAKAEGRDV